MLVLHVVQGLCTRFRLAEGHLQCHHYLLSVIRTLPSSTARRERGGDRPVGRYAYVSVTVALRRGYEKRG